MGWETQGRCRYYTRSRKRGGKVIREYIGVGALGELAAAADALQRAERRARAEALRTERERVQAAERLLRQLGQVVDALARGSLMIAGYFRHERGEWRYRHVRDNEAEKHVRAAGR